MQRVTSSKYSNVILLGNRLIAVISLFKSDDITNQIHDIEILESEIDDPHKAYKMAMVGGIAGGWIGAAASTLLLGRPECYLEFVIHLKDGNTVAIQTTQVDMIKFVLKWFNVKY